MPVLAEHREALANREVEATICPNTLGKIVVTVFLLLLASVPLARALIARGELAKITHLGQRVGQILHAAIDGREWSTVSKSLENDLLPETGFLSGLRGATQFSLTWGLGTGNHQVVISRTGEFWYGPDLKHALGPNFRQRPAWNPVNGMTTRTWNPTPAIVQFRDDLKQLGIELIVLPVPVKPGHQRGVMNAGERAWREELTSAKVTWIDALSGEAPEAYLRTDSHWTPLTVWKTVKLLSQKVRPLLGKQASHEPELDQSANDPPGSQATNLRGRGNFGDTAALLGLSHRSLSWLFPPESIRSGRNLDYPSQSDPGVVLLGDSFTNIYSRQDLGWGIGKGLGENLEKQLRAPVEVIALNSGGAYSSRLEFIRNFQANPERYRNTKCVIWEFSARELSFGDWRITPLHPSPTSPAIPTDSNQRAVSIEIVEQAPLPDLSLSPYRDALRGILVRAWLHGQDKMPQEIVLFVRIYNNRKWTKVTKWQTGERHQVRLKPWSHAPDSIRSMYRIELPDEELRLIDLPLYWSDEPVE